MQWKRYGQGKESSLENQKILFKFVVYVKINFNKIIKMKGDNNMARYIIPGFRKIETSGGGEGGTTNYNDLTNKPFINNVPLVGNLNTVNLKLTDATLTEEGVPAEAKTVGAKLEEQSTSLTALVEQLGNHTVKSDVPENAVFTDTIYDDTEVKKSIEELNSNLGKFEESSDSIKTVTNNTSTIVSSKTLHAGTYILKGVVRFPNATSDYLRSIGFDTRSSLQYPICSYKDAESIISKDTITLNVIKIIQIAADTTYNLYAYQNSGLSQDTSYNTISVIRIK